MADTKSIDFGSLLCSRLCHDLLNPVGALNNGVELLADETDPDMREQCMSLLAESARTSAAKLKFYRLAFGSAGGFDDLLPAHEVKAAIEGMFSASGRVTIDWMVGEDRLGKLPAKILLNLALIAGESLPRGGTLTIATEIQEKSVDIALRSEGPRLILDGEIRNTLEGKVADDAITSRTAAAAMVRQLVSEHGGDIILSPADQLFLMFGAHIPL